MRWGARKVEFVRPTQWLVIHAGDEVIVFDPCYDSYEPSVELAGGRCVHVQLGLDDFSIDWQKLEDALSPRTRMIILNSPHNPSGALISRAELDQLARLIADRDIYLISDEVYEHLVFDGVPHRSEERRVGKECRSRWSPYH